MFGWLNQIKAWWQKRGNAAAERAVDGPSTCRRLERVILTEGLARTLFEEYADHRRSERGREEIGWILLGLRQPGDAIAVAALPAGIDRDAGHAHIRFNSEAQALASRIVRQQDKRLRILGVVHTHPGSLRHPSDGDLQGDRLWVGQLFGSEGVFGIGTADVRAHEQAGAHIQISADMCFSWYALVAGEHRYRPLPVQVTAGPDCAAPLRPIWDVIEAHAEALNKLCRQFAKVQFDVIDEKPEPLLCVKIALAEPNQQLRLLLNHAEARYYWDRDGELVAIDPREPQLDRAVYLILAELASTDCESQRLVES